MIMHKTYVIGDIHGALKALKQVIARAPLQKRDTLIFLGDYVDGWSESGQVLDYLMQLRSTYNCIFLKGNHDVLLQDYLEEGIAPAQWLVHGGKASVECYKKNYFDESAHIEFIEQLHNYYIDDKRRLFVHAGFTSMQGPEKEQQEANFYWDRTLWETALAFNSGIDIDSPYYPNRFKLFEEIFIGHSSVLKFGTNQPMHLLNLWNLDTGAAYTGKLTIMDVDTNLFWQSDPVWELYPKEVGRNEKSFKAASKI
jgi:serine/threonine protein phosphatase 1